MEQKKSFKNLIWSKMIYRLMRKIYNNLFIFGDDGILEVPSLKKHLSKIINDLKSDILIVSTPPHSWLRIIPWVKYQYPTLPLIVDFRDGWTSTGLFRANSFMKKKYDNLGKTIFSVVKFSAKSPNLISKPLSSILLILSIPNKLI